MKNTLVELKGQSVKLVFWASDSEDKVAQQAARDLGGFLADLKTTYTASLDKLNPLNRMFSPEIEEYQETFSEVELESLALQSGLYSRFRVDPQISNKIFETIYKSWIRSSINHTLAKDVLVIRKNKKTVAMITLGEKENRGNIGLIAVDENYRGKGLGAGLVRSANAWFLKQGYFVAQVVTQGRNLAACKLYENCGYSLEKIENYYHFWL